MFLSGKSRIYGLLGDPVAHSLSPLMHNRAFLDYNIDAVYVPFHVSPRELSTAVAGLQALNVAGVNVTIPHKEAILPFLDQIDPSAQLIGAVNTIVVNDGGELVGYNTDGSGFLRSLCHELNFQPNDKYVVLLGAGGACRAAAVALAGAGVRSITIANRNLERAERLVQSFSPHFSPVDFFAYDYSEKDYLSALSRADLIVNTTSVGLYGEKINFLPLECIKGSALIYDMIYSATGTSFIESMQSAGWVCTNGLGMLAAQGEDAFFYWTGIRLPVGYMKKILVQQR